MSNRHRSGRSPLPLVLALAALLAGCDSTPTPPETGTREMRVQVIRGDAQSGFTGRALPGPVTVRVTGPGGEAVPGVPVLLAVTSGGGTLEGAAATTDALGEATAVWRLGGTAGTQTLSATLPGVPNAAAATVRAEALAPWQGDVVVVRGAEGRRSSVVLLAPGASESYTLPAGDSVLLLLPRAAASPEEEVAAFAVGRSPGLVTPVRWTEGRDSVEVRLAAPVRVPLAVWIVEGPFGAQAEKVRASLEVIRSIWAAAPIGAELGDVEIHDATGYAGDHTMSCGDERRAEIGETPGRINVYYVRSIPGFSGYACAPSFVLMSTTAAGAAMWPNLLAHEVGHTFFLFHNSLPGNVMVPNPPGSAMTEGQAFRAHFSTESSLNAVLDLRDRALLRPCTSPLSSPPGVARRCLGETFQAP